MANQQLYGVLAGATVVLTDAASDGKPITLADPPQAATGYVARASWRESASGIEQVWTLEPSAGSAYDAMLTLSKMYAKTLDDADALKVPALYDSWYQPMEYASDDRVSYDGTLYRCLQDHRSQASMSPDKSPSLWAKVLPGQDGAVGEWEQPGSTNGYAKGARVTHGGKTWESTADNNVWAPGTTGAPWTEVKE